MSKLQPLRVTRHFLVSPGHAQATQVVKTKRLQTKEKSNVYYLQA